MRLSKNKTYSLVMETIDTTVDYGNGLNGQEVRKIIGNASFDEVLGMFFSKDCKKMYIVTEK